VKNFVKFSGNKQDPSLASTACLQSREMRACMHASTVMATAGAKDDRQRKAHHGWTGGRALAEPAARRPARGSASGHVVRQLPLANQVTCLTGPV